MILNIMILFCDSEDKNLLGKVIKLGEGIRRLKYLCWKHSEVHS